MMAAQQLRFHVGAASVRPHAPRPVRAIEPAFLRNPPSFPLGAPDRPRTMARSGVRHGGHGDRCQPSRAGAHGGRALRLRPRLGGVVQPPLQVPGLRVRTQIRGGHRLFAARWLRPGSRPAWLGAVDLPGGHRDSGDHRAGGCPRRRRRRGDGGGTVPPATGVEPRTRSSDRLAPHLRRVRRARGSQQVDAPRPGPHHDSRLLWPPPIRRAPPRTCRPVHSRRLRDPDRRPSRLDADRDRRGRVALHVGAEANGRVERASETENRHRGSGGYAGGGAARPSPGVRPVAPPGDLLRGARSGGARAGGARPTGGPGGDHDRAPLHGDAGRVDPPPLPAGRLFRDVLDGVRRAGRVSARLLRDDGPAAADGGRPPSPALLALPVRKSGPGARRDADRP